MASKRREPQQVKPSQALLQALAGYIRGRFAPRTAVEVLGDGAFITALKAESPGLIEGRYISFASDWFDRDAYAWRMKAEAVAAGVQSLRADAIVSCPPLLLASDVLRLAKIRIDPGGVIGLLLPSSWRDEKIADACFRPNRVVRVIPSPAEEPYDFCLWLPGSNENDNYLLWGEK